MCTLHIMHSQWYDNTFAPANEDWKFETTEIEFQAGGNLQECVYVEIMDDSIPEGKERFEINLGSSDRDVIIVEPSRVVIEIEDDEQGETSPQQLGRFIVVSKLVCLQRTQG